MKVVLKKQPQKYLLLTDKNTQNKLLKALEELAELGGNIVKLKGTKDLYRYKIDHYRIVFRFDGKIQIITVEEINTRTNVNYKRR